MKKPHPAIAAVPCPKCKAQPGQACRSPQKMKRLDPVGGKLTQEIPNPRAGRPLATAHYERKFLYREQQRKLRREQREAVMKAAAGKVQ